LVCCLDQGKLNISNTLSTYIGMNKLSIKLILRRPIT
jgi:hypothetical protein